jgi:hypothetical protein
LEFAVQTSPIQIVNRFTITISRAILLLCHDCEFNYHSYDHHVESHLFLKFGECESLVMSKSSNKAKFVVPLQPQRVIKKPKVTGNSSTESQGSSKLPVPPTSTPDQVCVLEMYSFLSCLRISLYIVEMMIKLAWTSRISITLRCVSLIQCFFISLFTPSLTINSMCRLSKAINHKMTSMTLALYLMVTRVLNH